MDINKKYKYAMSGMFFFLAISSILLSLLIIMSANFNYNDALFALQDEIIGECEILADGFEDVLYNFEAYCPEVYAGINNGSIDYLTMEQTE